MYLLNFLPDYIIEINAVSVVNLVMACGLSVEFTVHIIIFYFRSKKVAQKSLKSENILFILSNELFSKLEFFS